MKQDGIFIRLNVEDRKILDELREKQSLNISQLFRNMIREKKGEMDERQKRK